ncbi:Hypothetical predicted protein [Octopus vulgaris]|uniref:Uncharacterized protein n=1 Tax=Octopus vulgaris TaxID=6645 RepID=A0AA36B3F5_OCTVU|nr:Hypothetical predicted protein [Octopus vulgaris]
MDSKMILRGGEKSKSGMIEHSCLSMIKHIYGTSITDQMIGEYLQLLIYRYKSVYFWGGDHGKVDHCELSRI